MGLFRTLLFVPGNNPRFLKKARGISADIVCLDLEDSVPDDQKSKARGIIAESLTQDTYESPVYVRTNPPSSRHLADDLEAVILGKISGIVVPKVQNAEEMDKLENILARLEAERELPRTMIIPSIESAQGVVNCHDIATSSNRVASIVFGIFDLLNDMGIEYTKESADGGYSRAKVPVDARAAGVPAIDSIWQDIRDNDGLERDCQVGRDLGYSGKCIIHPDQIETTHRIFRPSAAEISWARMVQDSYENSIKTGKGATTVDGRMIDEVHYKRAKTVLEWSRNHSTV